jgi:hypothetical protein
MSAFSLAVLLVVGGIQAPGEICTTAAERIRTAAQTDEELRALYASGQAYTDFLAAARRRAELWHENTATARDLDPSLVERAEAVGGTWRLLAVAIDACSDSVSTIPFMARLAALVPGLDLRIIDSTQGRGIMEAHPTPDGRPATPTVLLLDSEYNSVGCFIERPPTLQGWILDEGAPLSVDEIYAYKMSWYADDAGHETVATIVAMMEAAARGDRLCS